MVTTPPDQAVEDLGKLSVLAGVREFPVRVKCASLAWHTFKAALDRKQIDLDREAWRGTVKTVPMIPQDATADAGADRRDRRRSSRIPAKTDELRDAISAALKTVFDPEIPVDIWELGLIYDVFVDGRRRRGDQHDAHCARLPGGAVLPGQVAEAVRRVAGVTDAKVDVVWEPGWTKDRMSDAAKLQLGHVVTSRLEGRCCMLRLSKKADYALMAMKHLAIKSDVASISAREIAEQYDIPIELMAKVLQRLAQRGLLTSHQGTRGGYKLSKPTSAISVADIIQAIDGPLTVTACSTEDEQCGQFAKCNVRDPLWRIKDRIVAALATCSLPEIAAETPARRDGHAGLAHARQRTTVGALSRDRASRSISTITRRPRSIRACSPAMLPYFTEQFGNPAQPAACLGLGSAEAPSTRRASRSRRSSTRSPPRSSSPAAPANRTTSR